MKTNTQTPATTLNLGKFAVAQRRKHARRAAAVAAGERGTRNGHACNGGTGTRQPAAQSAHTPTLTQAESDRRRIHTLANGELGEVVARCETKEQAAHIVRCVNGWDALTAERDNSETKYRDFEAAFLTAQSQRDQLRAALEIFAPEYAIAIRRRDYWQAKTAEVADPGKPYCLYQAEYWDKQARAALAMEGGK